MGVSGIRAFGRLKEDRSCYVALSVGYWDQDVLFPRSRCDELAKSLCVVPQTYRHLQAHFSSIPRAERFATSFQCVVRFFPSALIEDFLACGGGEAQSGSNPTILSILDVSKSRKSLFAPSMWSEVFAWQLSRLR